MLPWQQNNESFPSSVGTFVFLIHAELGCNYVVGEWGWEVFQNVYGAAQNECGGKIIPTFLGREQKDNDPNWKMKVSNVSI